MDPVLQGYVLYKKRKKKDWKFFKMELEDISQFIELKELSGRGRTHLISIVNCQITTQASKNSVYFAINDVVCDHITPIFSPFGYFGLFDLLICLICLFSLTLTSTLMTCLSSRCSAPTT